METVISKTMDSRKEMQHYKSDWQEFYKQRMVSSEIPRGLLK
jgi:hypothetical protein